MKMPDLLRQFQYGIQWANAGDGRSFRFELNDSGFPCYYYHDSDANVSLVDNGVKPGDTVKVIEGKVKMAVSLRKEKNDVRKNNQTFNHKQRFGNSGARSAS